ncbi:MAG: NUDIX hydrolase [Myxococcota bacterium]|nr:NUDIX hydrolase [Myxococcales bacterium]
MERTDHATFLQKLAEAGHEGTPPVLAATVILLRDAGDGLETLMLRRNSKIVFGGMWVFPGGRIDDADWHGIEARDELAASRRAAEREALEECGLAVDPASMVPFSHWTPPPITPKRFLTWFFAARAEAGRVAIDHGEIHEHAWMSPVEALRRQAAQEIELAPPTFVTLTELAPFRSVDDALAAAAGREPERFSTVIGVADTGPVAMWHGDAGYDAADPARAGARHRLTMQRGGPWSYERSR